MEKIIKKCILLKTMICVTLLLSGCGIGINRDKSKHIFNPQALYQVPPQGLWADDLVEIKEEEKTRTGRIFLIPGTIIGYDPELVSYE
tara:strand:- start:535 stop:798 length:264 start_codon:yes stop_codon:yes gene_type:complete